MATIRVHELAKEMDLSSKDLLDKLQALGLNMKNHMSTIPSGEVNRIKNMVLNLETIKAQNEERPPKDAPQPVKQKEMKPRDVQVHSGHTALGHTEAQRPPQHRPAQPPYQQQRAPQQQQRGPLQQPPRAPQQQQRGPQQQPPRAPQQQPRGPQYPQQPRPPQQPYRDRPPQRPPQQQQPQQPGPSRHEISDNYLSKAETVLGEKAYERGGKTKTGGFAAKKQSRFEGNKRSDNKKGGKFNKNFKKQPFVREPIPVVVKNIALEGPLTVQEFAHLINKKATEVIKKLFALGVLATINQELDIETLILLGSEFGTTVEVKTTKEELLLTEEPDKPEELAERPPVVTIMGHVDHGKTSLLDVIRQTNVVGGEAGGITQHIGAYQVEVNGKKITFLDTPGHEAFTAMRARGAQITDIAILVVAADDGVMPQTVEAINHVKAAHVPMIVAINKIDKPEANPDRIKQELTEHGIVAEEWGGDAICVNVSAKAKTGLDNLLEMILLVAEMGTLKANPHRKAKGTVVEAKLDKGRGPVATLLVQNGQLLVGDFMIVGTTQGRVRAMQDDLGRSIKKAPPSTPVEVIGLNDVPLAGDVFQVVEDERLAKQLASERTAQRREEAIHSRSRVSLEDLFAQIREGEVRDLNIIIKADVQGSIEALKQSLEKLSNEEVRVNIIHQGVGGISETDVMLADTSDAIILGFNVRPDVNARKMAEAQQIDIKLYRVIYNAIEDVKAALSGLLKPEIREVVLGQAEVRAVFKVPKVGSVAGCYVTDGKISRNSQVRVIRDGIIVHEGNINSLKRFKEDAKEVASGYECGIGIERFNDIHEGDHLESFTFEEIKRELS
ncbi:MAG: translation initiation factor IF-2 [Clostridia bacterium]|jgi:translation initiation factor IF-2|nr:translation initiation factor IF-2 [Clostridia bacterium]